MMNQLFTVNGNGSLDILGIICNHLSSIRDLLALGQISDLTSIAVRAHQHNNLVTLCWPDTKTIVSKQECPERRDDEMINRYDLSCGRRRPIIRSLSLKMSAAEIWVQVARACDWLIETLIQHAAHLQRLDIHFVSFPALNSFNIHHFNDLNRQSDIVLRASTLTFPLCTSVDDQLQEGAF